jgi:hypothetical protein
VRDGHKREFCFRRRREERLAREMANKDRYHPSHGVLEPRVVPRSEGVMHTVPSWRDWGFPTRGAQSSHFWGRGVDRLVPLIMVHVMGMLSLAVVCLLDVLHLVINTSFGEVLALSLRGVTGHVFPFVVLVLLQRDMR